jgi:hypothetical protein
MDNLPAYQLRIVEKVFKLHFRNIICKFERMRKTATVLDSGLLPSSLYDCINKLTVHNMRCDLTPLIVSVAVKWQIFYIKDF